MPVLRGQDKCSECGMPLPNEDPLPEGAERTPCPNCGSMKRIKSAKVHVQVKVKVEADAKLVCHWPG